jgi:sec-independent protein translocase protein TatA
MNQITNSLAFLPGIGTPELLVIGVIALLLFGSRLPSVMRNLGRGIVEFKKGVGGIEDDIRSAADAPTSRSSSRARYDDADEREEASAPKFEPPAQEEGSPGNASMPAKQQPAP